MRMSFLADSDSPSIFHLLPKLFHRSLDHTSKSHAKMCKYESLFADLRTRQPYMSKTMLKSRKSFMWPDLYIFKLNQISHGKHCCYCSVDAEPGWCERMLWLSASVHIRKQCCHHVATYLSAQIPSNASHHKDYHHISNQGTQENSCNQC